MTSLALPLGKLRNPPKAIAWGGIGLGTAQALRDEPAT